MAQVRYFVSRIPPTEQTFLRDLDKKMWTDADKHRTSLDAAVYKHAVLGLIFLKQVTEMVLQELNKYPTSRALK
jgi:type I restriction-modification system DNA methylase subunit